MSKKIMKLTCVIIATTFVMLASSSFASAQQPVVVNAVTPTVVGYSAEPAGVFGLRTRYRPIVAPVATPVVVKPRVVVPPPRPIVRPIATPVVQTYYAPAPVVAPVVPMTYVGW